MAHSDIKSLIAKFKALGESGKLPKKLPAEISPSGLQLALVRVPLKINDNFNHLSAIEGGLRQFPPKLLNHSDYGSLFKPQVSRIRIAQRSLTGNNHQLLEDIALIECFMLCCLGFNENDNLLTDHIHRMLLRKT